MIEMEIISAVTSMQAVGLLLMWMMILSRAPPMILVFDRSWLCPMSLFIVGSVLVGAPLEAHCTLPGQLD
jgi:hypothetical protein